MLAGSSILNHGESNDASIQRIAFSIYIVS